MDGFVDFGWIFMQLGINAQGFLDKVSKFLQLYVTLLMFMEKLLFVARNIVVKPLREEHKLFFLSEGDICLKLVNFPC